MSSPPPALAAIASVLALIISSAALVLVYHQEQIARKIKIDLCQIKRLEQLERYARTRCSAGGQMACDNLGEVEACYSLKVRGD